MTLTGKKDVERLLREHYRAERGAPDEMSKAAALAAVRAAVASEQRSSASAETGDTSRAQPHSSASRGSMASGFNGHPSGLVLRQSGRSA